MDSMSVLFDRMGERDKAQWVGGEWAEKMGNRLVWTTERCDVNLQYCLSAGWTLLKEEEKEMGTEKWIPINNHTDSDILYGLCNDVVSYTPSEVMDKKTFLRWAGSMPDGYDYQWPGNRWYAWLHENEADGWNYEYLPEKGYTKQVFAEYAEMRVDK